MATVMKGRISAFGCHAIKNTSYFSFRFKRNFSSCMLSSFCNFESRMIECNTKPQNLHHQHSKFFSSSAAVMEQSSEYSNLLVSKFPDKAVALVRLYRPKSMNALCMALCEELVAVLEKLDKDSSVRAIVLTGTEKAFAAGADIREMSGKNYATVAAEDMFRKYKAIEGIRKPIIAAVNGYALGGGCEIAMMCDIILAGDKAKFGQPEILIGTIPGMGGTQRLTRAVGKSLAMEWILTGRQITAKEAADAGLVSRVIESSILEEEALKLAETIASHSQPAIISAKECVNRAYESSLQEGLLYELRAFHSTFASEDRSEGMTAFVEKRPPVWKHT